MASNTPYSLVKAQLLDARGAGRQSGRDLSNLIDELTT